MPLTNVTPAARMSDLVVHENDPSVGFSRESINITAAATVPAGKVYWRLLSTINPDTVWTVLDNTSQLVTTNEFAVVFGDGYGFNDGFTSAAIGATGTFNAVAFKRDVILKDAPLISAANATTLNTPAKVDNLRELLKRQGIILEKTITLNFA
jgi:hypothetical protein